jgi:hypothetical protein
MINMTGLRMHHHIVIHHSSLDSRPLFLKLKIDSSNSLHQLFIATFIFPHITSFQPVYLPTIKESDQMAATGRMLSVIREELPTVVNELASTAKVSTEQVGRLGEMEVASTATTAGAGINPIAVRQMASMSMKEGGMSTILLIHVLKADSRIINLIDPTPRPRFKSIRIITRTSPHSHPTTDDKYLNGYSNSRDGRGSKCKGSYFECDPDGRWGGT